MFYIRIQYFKLYCPRCGFHWTTVLDPDAVILGPEFIDCLSCQHPIATGMKEWPQLSVTEKRRFFFRWIPTLGLSWIFLVCGALLYCHFDTATAVAIIFETSFFLLVVLMLWAVRLCKVVLSRRRLPKQDVSVLVG